MIKGNFNINGQYFADWFNQWRLSQGGLFPYPLNKSNFEKVMWQVRELTGRNSLTLSEFVAIFAFIYNETGGGFYSLKELGGEAYYTSSSGTKVSYTSKEAGRGLNQLTGASNYRAVLSKLGYNYDSLSSEQLDQLFLRPSIYLAAFRIYLTDPSLTGLYFPQVNQGKFREYGNAIACGSPSYYSCHYGPTYEARCKALLSALEGAKLQNHLWNKENAKLLVGILLVFFILVYLYRREVWAYYRQTYQATAQTIKQAV